MDIGTLPGITVISTAATPDISTTIEQVKTMIQDGWIYVATVIAVASAISAVVKKQGEGWLAKTQDVVNLLALNFGHAKNETPTQ